MRINTQTPSDSYNFHANNIDVWHRRLSHISLDNVKKTAQITNGIEISNSNLSTKTICEPCIMSKSVRTQSRVPQRRALHAFDRVHIDIVGPINPTGFNGHRWAIMFTDDCHRARWLYTMKNKGDAFSKIRQFVKAISTSSALESCRVGTLERAIRPVSTNLP
jgi:hypothetical protein